MSTFDFRKPDYGPVFLERERRLARLRKDPKEMAFLRLYYREHPADFINDWGMTFDPRNPEQGLPAWVPFLLFDLQRDAIDYIMRKWKGRERGLIEKSRDMGLSWLTMALACTLCLFNKGIVIGFGSRKEEYVDKIGDPGSLFWKGREFMKYLPSEFTNGWDERRDAPQKNIRFPYTGSFIIGEIGDNIGRGNRTSIYIVDEAAHLEHPKLVDAALSGTTNCRIDVSSPNGPANSFAERRRSGKIEVFTYHWRNDPRKDDAWYVKKVDEIDDPVIVAQELDIDYNASAEGVLIPSAWVQAAVDAHMKLGHPRVTGKRFAAFDVGDTGDNCAWSSRQGVVIDRMEDWHGEGSDIFASIEKAFNLCDQVKVNELRYDAAGIGASVKGDGRKINEERKRHQRPAIVALPFNPAGSVVEKTREDIPGRKNEDAFANFKAQSWWALRERFRKTYRAVVKGERKYDFDEMISLSSTMGKRGLDKLLSELPQPTFMTRAGAGDIIDKTPEGSRSPNCADSVMILFAKMNTTMIPRVGASTLDRFRAMSRPGARQLVGMR